MTHNFYFITHEIHFLQLEATQILNFTSNSGFKHGLHYSCTWVVIMPLVRGKFWNPRELNGKGGGGGGSCGREEERGRGRGVLEKEYCRAIIINNKQ